MVSPSHNTHTNLGSSVNVMYDTIFFSQSRCLFESHNIVLRTISHLLFLNLRSETIRPTFWANIYKTIPQISSLFQMMSEEKDLAQQIEQTKQSICQCREMIEKQKQLAFEHKNHANLYLDAFIDLNHPIETVSPVQQRTCLLHMMKARQYTRRIQHFEKQLYLLQEKLPQLDKDYAFIKWGIPKSKNMKAKTDYSRHHYYD